MLNLEPMKERLEKSTPGPWYWQGVKSHKTVDLLTVRNGHQRVMGFERWGMSEASPVFRTENGMERVDTLGVPRQNHRPEGEFLSINHPDAELIAHAPEDMQVLISEVERLREHILNLSNIVEDMTVFLTELAGADQTIVTVDEIAKMARVYLASVNKGVVVDG